MEKSDGRRRAKRSVAELSKDYTREKKYSLRDDPRNDDFDEDDFDWEHAEFSGQKLRTEDDYEEVSVLEMLEEVSKRAPSERGTCSVGKANASRNADSYNPIRRKEPSVSEKSGKITGRGRKSIRKKKRLRKWAALLILMLLCVGAFFYWKQYSPDIGKEAPGVLDGGERKTGVYNILCMGIDKAGIQADVNMLAQIDCEAGNVKVIQIPRDTYINSGSNFSRINAYFLASYNRAYRDGITDGELRFVSAVERYRDMVSQNLGIVIDRYLCVDTAGFRDVIDAIGGVDFEVPCDLDYEDPYQDLYIHLKAGMQHLDGSQSEQYVRFRHDYAGADISRLDAQKMFLTAVFKQIKENMTVGKAVEVAKTALQYTTTDMTPLDIAYFAKQALKIDMNDVAFATIPGKAVINPTTGASYFVIQKRNAFEMISACMNVRTTSEMHIEDFDKNGFFCNQDADYIMEIYLSYDESEPTMISAGEIDEHQIDIQMK